MTGKTKSFLIFVMAVFMISLTTFAHHGTGVSDDESKPINLKGTVTEFRFANPHPQLFIEVKESGKVTRLAPN